MDGHLQKLLAAIASEGPHGHICLTLLLEVAFRSLFFIPQVQRHLMKKERERERRGKMRIETADLSYCVMRNRKIEMDKNIKGKENERRFFSSSSCSFFFSSFSSKSKEHPHCL